MAARMLLPLLLLLLLLAGGVAPAGAARPAGPPPTAPAAGGGHETQSYGRFGEVAVYRRPGKPAGVVVMLSDDDGWDGRADALARSLQSVGALVIGLDVSYYERKAERLTSDCSYPAGDFEMLSKLVQKKLDLPAYTTPVLAGFGEGATLAYGALAQSPSGTFAGAISMGFCPNLDASHPLCKGNGLVSQPASTPTGAAAAASAAKEAGGFRLQPVASLEQPWLLSPDPLPDGATRCGGSAAAEAFAAKIKGAAVVAPPKGNGKHQAAADLRAEAGLKQSLMRVLNDAELAQPPATPERHALADLPLLELRVPGSTTGTLAVIVSGDGGWTGLDRDVASQLVEHGYPVVGLNTLRYFWTPRTPEGAAADLTRILRTYMPAWNTKEAMLIGYSLGGEVLPFMAARLPPDLLGKVRLVSLLGPSRTTSFKFELSEWLGHGGGENRPVRPEVNKLKGSSIACIYGSGERGTSLCSILPAALATPIELPGAHYLGSNSKAVVNKILTQLASASLPKPPGKTGSAAAATTAAAAGAAKANGKADKGDPGDAAAAGKKKTWPPTNNGNPNSLQPPPPPVQPSAPAAPPPATGGTGGTGGTGSTGGTGGTGSTGGTGGTEGIAAFATLAPLAGGFGAGFVDGAAALASRDARRAAIAEETAAGGAAKPNGAGHAAATPAANTGTAGGPGEETLQYGRFGQVRVLRRTPHPGNVVLFFSGEDGWGPAPEAMAQAFAAAGYLTVGIDTAHYLQKVAAQHDSCAYTAGSLENLSKVVQKRLAQPRYVHPILAGYAGGAALAFGALAQAPPNTFGGGIGLAFSPSLPGGQALCPGHGLASRAGGPAGHRVFELAPPHDVEQRWVAIEGSADATATAAAAAPLARATPGGEVIAAPGVDHAFARADLWQPALRQALDRFGSGGRGNAPPPPTAPGEIAGNAALPGLPVIEMAPAGAGAGAATGSGNASANANAPLAVILSGDGGWAGVDREVAKVLAGRRGVPVVGLDTLEYFWNGRTPAAAAADLERLLRHYLAAWKRDQVVLAGYSLGADVLPLLASRLPADLLAHVRLVALLGPSHTTPLEIRIKEDKASELPVLPDLEKLRGRVAILCIGARGEADSLCPQIGTLGQSVELEGSHAFSGDYEALADRILKAIKTR